VESFDQSLKHLLQQEPAEFIHFGLGDDSAKVLESLPTGLPAPGRDVDGSYLIEYRGTVMVAHIEFHRRHQSQEELAVDVLEAQVRLYRRSGKPVLTLVWDLYGRVGEPVLEDWTLKVGALQERPCTQCVYHRVNLRGLGWEELLAHGPPVLWALVPLTADGASTEAVRQARDAIEGRKELTEAQRANHLAVLMFVAEAEGVPLQVMRDYITREKLMASTLYQEIMAEGGVQKERETITRILTHRLGSLEPEVRDQIWNLNNTETLTRWYDEAIVADGERARELAERIKRGS
jgi:hypothetical protein